MSGVHSFPKVLHIIGHMEKGGAERQLNLLVKASRHQHVIAVLPGNHSASSTPVEILPGLSPFAIYRSVRDMIRRHEVGIVHLWLPDRITIPAMVAAKAEGCRIISGDRRKARNYGVTAIRDRLNYINHVAADLVIPNYPYYAPTLSLRRMLGILKRTRVILNGLDVKIHNAMLTDIPAKLLFTGRLVEQKRVGVLIDLMPELISRGLVDHLDIVGDGPLMTALQKQTNETGYSDKVTFHGYQTDWGERFSPNTHAFVLPSASEGMSNSLFEAIAWGFVPIVTQTPELAAILEDWQAHPFWINPKSPNSIIDALSALASETPHDLLERCCNLQAGLGQLSVAHMSATYDEVYDALGVSSYERGGSV